MLTAYKITKSNGETYATSMAANVTLAMAKDYFMGKTFVDEDPETGKETTWHVVKVEEIKGDKDFSLTFTGRERGAVGIRYRLTKTVRAADLEAAELKLYDDYDHISNIFLNGIKEI